MARTLVQRKPNWRHYKLVGTFQSPKHYRPDREALDLALRIRALGGQPKVWWNKQKSRWEVYELRRKVR